MNTDQIRVAVARAREIEKGVTEGPWKPYHRNIYCTHIIDAKNREIADAPRLNDLADSEGVANRNFIAESRTLLPNLANHCDELMREIEVRDLALDHAIKDQCNVAKDIEDKFCVHGGGELARCTECQIAQARRDIAEEAE